MLWRIISTDPFEGIKRSTYVSGDLMYVDKDTGALHIQSYTKITAKFDNCEVSCIKDNAVFAKGQWDQVFQEGEVNSKTNRNSS